MTSQHAQRKYRRAETILNASPSFTGVPHGCKQQINAREESRERDPCPKREQGDKSMPEGRAWTSKRCPQGEHPTPSRKTCGFMRKQRKRTKPILPHFTTILPRIYHALPRIYHILPRTQKFYHRGVLKRGPYMAHLHFFPRH